LEFKLGLAETEESLPVELGASGEDKLEKRLLFGELDDQRLLAGSMPRFGGCIYVSQAS
jgi:hypothetical protein